MLTRNGWAFVALTVACLAVGIAADYREFVVLGLALLLCLLFAGVWLALRPRVEVKREIVPARVDEAEAALVVHAAARAGLAADLTRQHGASATWIVTPNGTWNLIDDDLAAAQITHPTPQPQTAAAAMPQPDASASPDETSGI